MNTPPAANRVLQIAAVMLAIANLVLCVVWLQREGTPPPVMAGSTGASGAAEDPTAVTSAAAATTKAAADGPHDTPSPLDAAANRSQTATLFGSVRRHDGSKPANGWVGLTGRRGSQSGSSGSFAFAGLTPGSHQITARFDDELPFKATVEVAAPSTRFDIVLDETWLLTVSAVTPDGAPLMEAIRKTDTEVPWFRGLSAAAFEAPVTAVPMTEHTRLTAGLGEFREPDVWRGEKAKPQQVLGVLTLPPGRAVHVALLLRGAIVAQLPAAPGQSELVFTLTPEAVLAATAMVKFRLVDEKGAPIAGASVGLHDAQTHGGGPPSDAEGRVVLRNVQPGRLSLGTMNAKLTAPPLVCDVTAGANLDLGDIVMRERVKVDLVIEPTADRVFLHSLWLEPLPGPAWDRKSTYTGGDGSARTVMLHPGRNALFASCDTGCAIVELDTAALPPQPLRMVLQPGASLRVENRVGPRFTRATVRSPGGVIVFSTEASGTWERTVRVPVGTYEVVCTGMNGTSTKQITVGTDGATLVID